ncbi:MAG: NAD-dependent epimerase/dehydratase family protein [Bacteroidetes bacterium]|nr:NAD-dependent epimerase/dehydratase family protein [Bacteroidota bacterium]
MEKLKKILVIGGDSFIARRFINQCKGYYKIRTISRIATGYPNELLTDDFFQIPPDEFRDADAVINFAAIVHPTKKIKDSAYFRINRDLAVDLAKKTKICGADKFVQMSTIAVYGRVEYIDKDTIENPVTPYGISKYNADLDLMKMSGEKFKVIILRPAMVYGGDNAPGNMMKLIKLIAKGFPLPFGNIHYLRDFLHVDNLVSFIDSAIEKDITGICLLCDGYPVSVTDLVKIAGKHLGIKLWLFPIPGILLEILRKLKPSLFEKLYGPLRISYSDITAKFGFVPRDCIDDGIRDMVRWHLDSIKK